MAAWRKRDDFLRLLNFERVEGARSNRCMRFVFFALASRNGINSPFLMQLGDFFYSDYIFVRVGMCYNVVKR